jgi:hypothetical protein
VKVAREGLNKCTYDGFVTGKKFDYRHVNGERREEYQYKYMKCINACKVFKSEWQQRTSAQK